MEIRFPGGVAVEALYKGFTIRTDQPVADGGGNSAPSPFDLFLASLGACAGYYALRFCQERKIPTDDLSLTLTTERDPLKKRLSTIRIEVRLPEGFPGKYEGAILRAIDQCSVKRHVVEAPAFEVVTRRA
ncbi:MAG TPA: OsmC family protein [Thermoanaerobaculia bacterium]|nr:OsmC family protein [Thermoanaerobaculia bacterium]HQR67970.1 OsmC family protein [Thermoanaerobaculia bacterium]